MPPRRSASRSRRSTSRSRTAAAEKAAPARRSTSRRSATPKPSVAPTNGAVAAPCIEEARNVDAILSARPRCGAGVGPATTQVRGWGYWLAIVLMQVLVLVWLRWSYEMYRDFRYGSKQ